MAYPHLSDDGTTVELDVHGTGVDDALDLVRSAARLSAERGRATLRVIHGSSTSNPLARNRTIKHALEDALLDGIPGVATFLLMEDFALLSLDSRPKRESRRISLLDLH